ncbi:MAG: hypothetical protein JWM57_1969 [Phycisphaerales bacterium]|nr:hypothetical protein [Phycisphaerales bacterium]
MTIRGVHLPDWAIIAIPFGFFVVIAVLGTLLSRLLSKRDITKPVPANERRPPARGCLVGFGAIFAAAGLAVLVFVGIRPVYRAHQAASWPTVPGHVTVSRLDESRDSDGSTYRIDIHYTYTVNGRSLESNQYDGTGTRMWSGGRQDKMVVVQAHRAGSAVVVHYNPADPTDAMLSTATPSGTLFSVLFAMPFIAVGVLVMVFAARMRPPGAPVAAKAMPIAANVTDARGGRRRSFFAILAFAMFWNAFVTVFFIFTHTWCMIPFALVGVLLIAFTGYNGLQLFNPVVAVQFAHMPLRPGERCDVSYSLSGNFLALRNLVFTLEGHERVTYRQGTDTRNETHVAWRLPLLETTNNAQYERGKFTIALPADAMTSFIASNNQFTWHLCCRGDIPGRPDIKDDFDVTVLANVLVRGAT